MKPCPFCAEEIQEGAIRCRSCHGDLAARGAGWPFAAALGLGTLAVLLAAAAPSRTVDRGFGPELVAAAADGGCPALSALPPGHPPLSGLLPPGHPPVPGLLPLTPGHPAMPSAPAPAAPAFTVDPRPLVRTYVL